MRYLTFLLVVALWLAAAAESGACPPAAMSLGYGAGFGLDSLAGYGAAGAVGVPTPVPVPVPVGFGLGLGYGAGFNRFGFGRGFDRFGVRLPRIHGRLALPRRGFARGRGRIVF